MYNNYKVIKQEELKDIASRGTLLKHEKSGARVVILENDDENKMFLIGFKTPPHDDTGVPHIIEHSVLCGSRKYPVKEPFVELMKGSLNTFLNAMTFSDKTVYPVASCNDKDFQNLMDVYMDAVLYPNILTNEKIFKQEGEILPEGNLLIRNMVEAGIDRVKTIGNIREKRGAVFITESHKGKIQKFIRSIADQKLFCLQVIVFRKCFSQKAALRV